MINGQVQSSSIPLIDKADLKAKERKKYKKHKATVKCQPIHEDLYLMPLAVHWLAGKKPETASAPHCINNLID